jgi:DNA-binding transcriptional LysR family regulator
MDWEDLRHFLALAKSGSLSGAARQLSVDHTTVARRVAALEDTLKLRLVDRLPKAVLLTLEGQKIAEAGSKIEEDIFSLLRIATGANPDLEGTVSISAPPAYASLMIAPRLQTLRHQFPGLVINLLGELSASDLNRRDADIAIRLTRPDNPSLIARKLAEMPFGFYAATGFDGPESEWQFIGHSGPGLSFPDQKWLDERLDGRRIVMWTNDVLSQANAAANGFGVAILPEFVGEGYPGLELLSATAIPPPREIWMLVHDDLRRAPRIRAVMDFMVEITMNQNAKSKR